MEQWKPSRLFWEKHFYNQTLPLKRDSMYWGNPHGGFEGIILTMPSPLPLTRANFWLVRVHKIFPRYALSSLCSCGISGIGLISQSPLLSDQSPPKNQSRWWHTSAAWGFLISLSLSLTLFFSVYQPLPVCSRRCRHARSWRCRSPLSQYQWTKHRVAHLWAVACMLLAHKALNVKFLRSSYTLDPSHLRMYSPYSYLSVMSVHLPFSRISKRRNQHPFSPPKAPIFSEVTFVELF